MARINPCSLPRPKAVSGTESFSDDLQPGVVWTLTFEVQAGSDFDLALSEKTNQYTSDYVTGKKDDKGAPLKPLLLPPIDGKRVQMTRSLCSVIAMLELMDATPLDEEEKEEKWGLNEWRGMCVTAPSAFNDISTFVQALYEQAYVAEKKPLPEGAPS